MKGLLAGQKKRSRIRLRTILFVLEVLIVICSVLATAFCCYLAFRSSLIERVGASRNDVLMQTSAKADLLLGNMVSMSRIYSSMLAGNSFGEMSSLEDMAGGDVLEAYRNVIDVEYSLTVLAEDGASYIYEGGESKYDLSEFQKELWYLNIPSIMKEDEVYWTQSHKAPSLGDDFYFSAVRRVRIGEEKEIMVLLSISERALYEMYRDMISSNCIYIVNQSGRVISSSNESLVSLNYFNVKRLDTLVESGNYAIVEKSGEKYLLSRYDNPKYGMIYLEEIPLRTLLSSLDHIQKWSVIVSAAAIFLSCAACWWIIHTLTSPLLVLCRKLKMVSEGKFDTEFDVESWKEISLINDACARMERKISDLFQNLKREEKEKRLAEIEFLQAQINPHFMYNTLFEIKCLVNMGENREAEWMLENFIAMLRTVLSYKDELIPLQEELVILQQYFEVMKCKYGNEIQLVYHIPESLLQKVILKFVLQPIVENSIFHGLNPAENRLEIIVSVREDESHCYVEITDNGVGMDAEHLEKIRCGLKEAEANAEKDSVGIQNVDRRIRLHFGPQYGLKISSQKNVGTRVLLILPNKMFKE